MLDSFILSGSEVPIIIFSFCVVEWHVVDVGPLLEAVEHSLHFAFATPSDFHCASQVTQALVS